MKIIQVYPYPAPYGMNTPKLPGGFGTGGGETYPLRLSLKLAEIGNEVIFLTGYFPGIKRNPLVIGNLKIIYLPLKMPKKMIHLSFSNELVKKMMMNYDVLNCWQLPFLFTLEAEILAKFKNKKTFASHVGFYPQNNIVSYMISYFSSLFTDKIFVPTEYSSIFYKSFFPEKKIKPIPHGIDTDFFYRRENDKLNFKKNDEKIILYVGRLLPSKGLDVLIRAIYIILKKGIKVKAVIVGKGWFEEYLKNLVRKLGIEKNIVFVGFVSNDDLPYYYSMADVLVLPSVYKDCFNRINLEPEGFGLVLAEAMSCKTPTVASRVAAIPYWVKDGKTGLLFEPGNAEDLSDKIIKIITDENFAQKIVLNAFREIKMKYSLDVVSRIFLKEYEL